MPNVTTTGHFITLLKPEYTVSVNVGRLLTTFTVVGPGKNEVGFCEVTHAVPTPPTFRGQVSLTPAGVSNIIEHLKRFPEGKFELQTSGVNYQGQYYMRAIYPLLVIETT